MVGGRGAYCVCRYIVVRVCLKSYSNSINQQNSATFHLLELILRFIPSSQIPWTLEGEGYSHTWVLWWWPPIFEIFYLIGPLLYASSQSDWPPLSTEKIGLSLSHLVPEILGPKVGLIFHHNLLFNSFL